MAKDKPPAERQGFHFQFITTPTSDTPGTALLLFFNNRRYIFGQVAEGLQRACIQRGVAIKKVRNVFLTGRTTWKNLGGLTGLILTMADVQSEEKDETTGKRPRLNIHGGPKIAHAIACARRFVFRTGMPINIIEADLAGNRSVSEPTYSDENINVWSLQVRRGRSGTQSPLLSNERSASPDTVGREQALRQNTVANMFDSDWRRDRLVETRFDKVKLPALIWHRNPETKELSQFRCTSMADAPDLAPDTKVFVRNPWPAALVGDLPPADNLSSSTAMSYIMKGHTQRGSFLPKKAKELGVPPGPVYARLAAGETITLNNGNVVTSEMVLAPSEPGKGMAVFDIPTIDHLDDLAAKLEELSSAEVLSGVEVASWLLGPTVFYSARYRELVASLPRLKHFIASPETCANRVAFESSSATLLRLSHIRPECFHEPVHQNSPPPSPGGDMPLAALDFQPAELGLIMQLQPKTTVSTEEVPKLFDVKMERTSGRRGVTPLIPAPLEKEFSTPYDDIEIITLGTGSAVPSKYRNVSASLLRIPGLGNYLIDCGENTLGQLRRVFTADELDDVLADLRMIWISHLHADHHLGTLAVIHARDEVLERLNISKPDLYLISEQSMANYMMDFSSIQPNKNCILVACLDSVLTLNGAPCTIDQTSLPIKEFLTTQVSHCHGAQAVSITFENGFKFSYSGDCRPSAKFAKIGVDSDVLLHEATFDDGMEGDAMAKKHSTTGEALGVAMQMRAKQVILTHFSQRYQKLPVLNHIKTTKDINFEEGNDQDAGPIDNSAEGPVPSTRTNQTPAQAPAHTNTPSSLSEVAAKLHTCVAFDLMRVKVHQIRDMHRYYPAIEKMFEMELEKNEAAKEVLMAKTKLENNKKSKGKVKEKNQPTAEKRRNSNSSQTSQSIYDKINRGKSSKRNSNSHVDTQPSASATGQPPTKPKNPPTPSKRAQRAALNNQTRQRHAPEQRKETQPRPQGHNRNQNQDQNTSPNSTHTKQEVAKNNPENKADNKGENLDGHDLKRRKLE